MKPLLTILAVCLGFCLQAAESPILRTRFTTNYPPQNVAINGQTNLGVFFFPPVNPTSVSDLTPMCVVLPGGQAFTYEHIIFGNTVIKWLRDMEGTNIVSTNLFAQAVNGGSGNFTAPVLSTDPASSNSPAGNQFPTAGWVRGLFAGQGIEIYNTTNISTIATNTGSPEPVFTFATTVPFPANRTFTGVTNNQYIGSTVTTNRFQTISGPIVGNTWVFFPSGGGRSLTLHEEIYFSYDGTNWFGDYETGNQVITAGVTNLYSFLVAFPTYTSTNAAGFYIQKRRKVGIQTANPNVTIWVGTNTPSHMDLAGPNTLAGNAVLSANQTFSGANTFTGQTVEKSIFKTPTYTNATTGATTFVAVFGQDETVCEVQTNAVSILSSTNRLTNVVAFANWTINNYCGSNATISLNTSWRPLGSCTNSLTLTNNKVLRLSVGYAGRAVVGFNDETNVFFGYAFQP